MSQVTVEHTPVFGGDDVEAMYPPNLGQCGFRKRWSIDRAPYDIVFVAGGFAEEKNSRLGIVLVYRAFIEADALAKWLPPNGFACTVHQLDAKVGGTFRMSFRNFTTSDSHSFGGEFIELVPHERLRHTDKFDAIPTCRAKFK